MRTGREKEKEKDEWMLLSIHTERTLESASLESVCECANVCMEEMKAYVTCARVM